jgi:hypothetical protein
VDGTANRFSRVCMPTALDSTFTIAGAANGDVNAVIALQPDGKS